MESLTYCMIIGASTLIRSKLTEPYHFITMVLLRTWPHADVIAKVFVPALTQHVNQAMTMLGVQSDSEMTESEIQALKKNFWTGISVSIKDSHAMEKWVESLLREMAVTVETDVQAYCILWMSFGSLLSKHSLTRYVVLTIRYITVR